MQQQRVILIHGWGGNPDEAWMPDFKRRLTASGFEVIAVQMPDTDAPQIGSWVGRISELVGSPDGNTHLVGHSVGCQAIMRYLAALPEYSRVGHVVFVAPWFNLMNLEEGEDAVAKPWIETPIDLDAVRRNSADITAIFSDDDPVVPIENAEFFRERLDAHVIVEHAKGHLSQDSGVSELPSALVPFGI